MHWVECAENENENQNENENENEIEIAGLVNEAECKYMGA